MNLYNTKLEFSALRSIMSGDDHIASWILPRVSAEHFDLDSSKETYRCLMKTVRKRGTVPLWSDLIEDMSLSQDTREELAMSIGEVVANRKIAKRLVDRLDEYRRVRVLFDMAKNTALSLKADRVDLEELTDRIGDYLFKARSTGDITECMLHVGDAKLDTRFVQNLLDSRQQEFIPTGFSTFDNRNQGIPRGSLFLIAGTTGGGKTVMANNIGVHQARQGHRVAICSLEMKREHNVRRILSSLTEVPLSRLNNPSSLTRSEKVAIMQVWVDYHKQVRRRGGRLTLISPVEDVSMEDVLTLLKPYEYDNKIIDYVGLLKGMDGEDQARRLGTATRYAARDAAATDSVVTVLAQLSADGLVRYSRAMVEHAAVAWQWSYTYDSEARESKIITVKQAKARQLEAFDFQLQERFGIMKLVDVDVGMITGAKPGSRAAAKNKRKPQQVERTQQESAELTFQM